MSDRELLLATLPPCPHIEVREKRDGTWTVWYPDPGWIPCAPNCQLNKVQRAHKHDYEQTFVETHYVPTSFSDAMAWAEDLAEGREIKVLPYMTLGERNAARAAAKKEAQAAA